MEGAEDAKRSPPPEEDDVLREQSFKRPQGLNLDAFMLASTEEDPEPSTDPVPEATTGAATAEPDVAVGDVKSLFTMASESTSTVDSTTQMAVHGEQTIGKGLAVAMVVVWTAIGALVGTCCHPSSVVSDCLAWRWSAFGSVSDGFDRMRCTSSASLGSSFR